MPISLHSALVPTWLRILGAAEGWLTKAEAFAEENGIPEAEMLDQRLIADMRPFAYQIKAMTLHSRGAIEGVRKGTFSPDTSPLPDSFEALKRRLAEATDFLLLVDEEEMESWIGKPMAFAVGERRMEFTAEEFLLSFSQSNFHFHATTAYALLRKQGIEVGKRDFMGHLPIKA